MILSPRAWPCWHWLTPPNGVGICVPPWRSSTRRSGSPTKAQPGWDTGIHSRQPAGTSSWSWTRFADARQTLEDGRRAGEELSVRWHLNEYHDILALGRYLAGEWDDALAELEASAELAGQTGEAYTLVLGQSVKALIEFHRNDLRGAAESTRTAAGQLARTGPRYRTHWAVWARALLLEAGGETAEALAALSEVWDHCARSGLALEYPVIGPDLIRLALAAGNQGERRMWWPPSRRSRPGNDVAWLAGCCRCAAAAWPTTTPRPCSRPWTVCGQPAPPRLGPHLRGGRRGPHPAGTAR